jgi:hypothetical protein
MGSSPAGKRPGLKVGRYGAAREVPGRGVTGDISSRRKATQTAAASEELLTARETIEVARAARASDEHDRKVRQLRDIGQLAESLFWKTVRDAEAKPPQHGWRTIEHNYLEQALVGMAETLPKTVALTSGEPP